MQKIRIIGLDPALRNTGVAFAEYDMNTGKLTVTGIDVIRTEKFADNVKVRTSSDDLKCAGIISAGLRAALTEFKPAFVCSEVSVFAQSSRGSFTNGVCCGILGSLPLPIIEVSQLEVKLAAGGTKASSKDFMTQWAVARWPGAGWMTRKVKGEVLLKSGNEHAADACAAIAAGILTPQFAQAVSMIKAMKAA